MSILMFIPDIVNFGRALAARWNMPTELAVDLAALSLYDVIIYAGEWRCFDFCNAALVPPQAALRRWGRHRVWTDFVAPWQLNVLACRLYCAFWHMQHTEEPYNIWQMLMPFYRAPQMTARP